MKRSRYALFSMLVAALLMAGCTRTYFAALNTGSREPLHGSGGAVYDVVHGLRVDVYRPAGEARDRALVVFLYGGRWRTGSRAQYAFVGEALAARGIVAVLPDYRAFPDAPFPDFVGDAARAVAWAHAHARELGAAPDRVFVAGHSAGAHLAALLATDARYLAREGLAPRSLAGAIGIAGAYDFLPLTAPDLREVFASEAQQHDSQPVNFVDGDEPPFLLLHGTSDRSARVGNSESLAQRLRAAGVSVRLVLYPDVGHVRILSAMRFPRLAPALDDIERFVDTQRRAMAAQPPGSRPGQSMKNGDVVRRDRASGGPATLGPNRARSQVP